MKRQRKIKMHTLLWTQYESLTIIFETFIYFYNEYYVILCHIGRSILKQKSGYFYIGAAEFACVTMHLIEAMTVLLSSVQKLCFQYKPLSDIYDPRVLATSMDHTKRVSNHANFMDSKKILVTPLIKLINLAASLVNSSRHYVWK